MNNSRDHEKRPLQTVMLNSWGWSQRGEHKEENEDAFLNWPERYCWAVADGVGSSDYAARASQFLIKKLMSLPEATSLENHVQNARACLEEANALLSSRAMWPGTASSTIVLLLIHEEQASCLWAGDSRCYLLRDNVLYQCTNDHTLRQEKIDSGELTRPEAYRMVKGNIITNAIGTNSTKLDEVRFILHPGDRILLCSDGLSNILNDIKLTSLLYEGNAHTCAERIREAIMKYPHPDDTSFVTIFLS